jgi:hypothetical protein
MSEPRASRGPTPHGIAAMATSLVLLTGLGVGAYFVELRGAGLQAQLQAGHGREMLVLLGLLALVAGTAQFAVSAAVRQLRSSASYRALVNHALEIDYADPDAVKAFDSAPELRDLVGMLAAEKEQVRDLGDRLEALRGEVDGVSEGMQRAASDLGRLREESLSEVGQQLIGAWNEVVGRARRAEEGLEAAQAAGEGRAHDAPAEAQRSGAVLHRLESLEGELRGLRAALQQATSARVAVTPQQMPVPMASPAAVLPTVSPAPTLQRTTPSAPRPALFASEAGEPGTRFEDTRFPHFVGQPVGPIPDRVEVTYEGTDGQQPEDLPDSALLFEAEDDDGLEPVLDLQEFGAVEIRE